MAKGGAIKPVVVVTDSDLEQNGGRYLLGGGAAIPIEGVLEADIASNESIEGGSRLPVYVVATLNSPQDLQGGKPAKMSVTGTSRKIRGHIAQPVYVVSGSLS